MKFLNKKLNHVIITAILLLPLSSAFANHPLQVETKSSEVAGFANVKTTVKDDSINISGEVIRNKNDHLIIPGIVKLELLDENGKVLKTVNAVHKRHKHRVNNAYMFKKRVSVTSLHVSKVRVIHEKKSQH